jgi:hypothetical protein
MPLPPAASLSMPPFARARYVVAMTVVPNVAPPHCRTAARRARSAVVAALLACWIGLVGGGACPTPTRPDTPDDTDCPSLDAVCPSLSCVEARRDDDGCPLCECEVQACVDASDCLNRGVDVVCDVGFRFCEPAPGCTDGDAETPCPAACYGRCLYAGERSRTDGYCSRADDCVDGETCQQTTCVDDPTTPNFFDCVGWCAGGCAEVETLAFDPQNGFCVFFPNSCIPPGWSTEPCR